MGLRSNPVNALKFSPLGAICGLFNIVGVKAGPVTLELPDALHREADQQARPVRSRRTTAMCVSALDRGGMMPYSTMRSGFHSR